jgi:hypothetical protein
VLVANALAALGGNPRCRDQSDFLANGAPR